MSEPPETDLDFYSRPENYTGGNLQAIQKFNFAKQKQEREVQQVEVVKKKKSGFDLFARYKHLLKGYVDEEEEENEEEEEDDDVSQKITNIATAVEAMLHKSEEEDKVEEKTRKISTDSGVESPTTTRKTDTGSPLSLDSPLPPDKFDVESRSSFNESKLGSSPTPRKQSSAMSTKDGRSSVSLRMTQKIQISKELRRQELREKFRKAVKMIKNVLLLSHAADGADSGGGMKTFMDIATETEQSTTLKNSGLSFDPSYFKAKKEINISNEVKQILSLPSEQRSPEQVQTAMFGLQIMRSFAEYPLHMQEKLAKVAWFEVVPPKRIIIRQGHIAENFYFVLSGQAVVTLMLRDPKTGATFVKTATIMRRGMSFGELALLHHSRRTATVTSQDTVQLLSIGREDFFDIFMAGAGPDQLPEHVKFISECKFMKNWPIELLLEHPEHCLLHFFKRNVVIVKDSTASEWIYVVKSGSCEVLKQLKGVKARIGWGGSSQDDAVMKLPKDTSLPGPKVDTGIRKRRKVKSAGDVSTKQFAENQENVAPDSAKVKKSEERDKKFSKAEYSKFPITQKAHLVPLRNHSKSKKPYEVPDRCKPPKPPEPPKDPPGTKPPPVFVAVESLKPKDAFGLDTIQFEDSIENPQTVVTLVSRGAECIMLNKAYFAKHANEHVKKLVREQIRPYPGEATFQDNLQIKANWELYKSSLIEDLTSQYFS
ncbi:hypothetical protein FSP39_012359 [Pinctada imbricata]|uniref:Cyclic nucleotide-binding domain-containing protein n=1 Tax=Pinctada imbricata TaxID=66713 RepID=A0AA89BXB0_PINIB|nr:hypothetical protein FSP39_012359 [Pinctada imbricata]